MEKRTEGVTGRIEVIDSKIYTFGLKSDTYSDTSITITPGLNIGLGMKVEDYIEVLKEVSLPIVVVKFYEDSIERRYTVRRMGTGVVESKDIAFIASNNGFIDAVTFNQDLVDNEEFRKYVQLSVMHQFRIREGLSDIEMIQMISEALEVSMKAVEMIKTDDNIDFLIGLENVKMKYEFTKAEKGEYYTLLCISLV